MPVGSSEIKSHKKSSIDRVEKVHGPYRPRKRPTNDKKQLLGNISHAIKALMPATSCTFSFFLYCRAHDSIRLGRLVRIRRTTHDASSDSDEKHLITHGNRDSYMYGGFCVEILHACCWLMDGHVPPSFQYGLTCDWLSRGDPRRDLTAAHCGRVKFDLINKSEVCYF